MIPNRSLIYLDDFFRFLCKILPHGSVLLSKFEPTFGNEVLISKGHCRANQKSERYFTLSKRKQYFMEHEQMDFEPHILLGCCHYGAADAGEILATIMI
ncbi:MAG: hypothetical protein V1766_01350, partial [Pseudomonadota bacterium]